MAWLRGATGRARDVKVLDFFDSPRKKEVVCYQWLDAQRRARVKFEPPGGRGWGMERGGPSATAIRSVDPEVELGLNTDICPSEKMKNKGKIGKIYP